MKTLTVSFPIPFSGSNHRLPPILLGLSRINRFTSEIKAQISIRSPPLGFDYRTELAEESRKAVAAEHPELMDLVNDGRLVIVEKRRFGPVPEWRREFVEPEAIWLVGTSHVSQKSVMDVERVIRALSPDNVVVELCRSRAGIMYASKDVEDASLKSNMFSLGGTEFFGAVNRSINLGGQSAFALRLLLAVFSSKISLGAKGSFGEEFRAARKSSEEVGAQIVLGDRPIEITLERAWNSLVRTEKLRLVISLFRGITSSTINISETDIDGGPFQLYQQLSKSYPSLLQPLMYERDTYLAWSLKRSKAVNNSKRVVGVIGKGHMNGVVYALISDQGNLRFRDLAGSKAGSGSNGWVSSLLKSLVRDTILGFILWAIYELLENMLPISGLF
ncbi:hypothetical protein MA16_Dca009347 [Dendrobium catenatum]|uniref:TraB domain-containing protein n=1 Tax=Dendrobium catenatum TaxID=906689 RepID=A0A2I0XH12_9ASPA|nr:hypothetical protein MA16_Dca009347 [Dendrobium catenatum]